MNNRTLLFMTMLVLLGIGVLFAINLTSILSGHPPADVYLNPNNVRGIAIKHHNLLYTLNFQQQNDVIHFINRSIPIMEIKSDKQQATNIQQMIIYPFEGAKEIVLTPISYVDQNLIFSAPAWTQGGYLMDVSEGRFKELLSQTYDP